MDLRERVAIVTGAVGTLGKGICRELAQEGMHVAVADLNQNEVDGFAEEIKTSGGSALGIAVDVTSRESTVEMTQDVIEAFGRIDVLINNAAIYADIVKKPFYEISVREWNRLMTVNLRGVFLCCKAVFPYMRDQGKGKIVNIASSVAFSGGHYFAHYTASKGGVIAFTWAIAREIGQYNINVNAVAPGTIDTDIISNYSCEMRRKRINEIPLKRLGNPEDIANTCLFLATGLSDYITGETINVNGGLYIH